MRLLSCVFEVRFIEFKHRGGRMRAADGRGLQNFVIQSYRQFSFIQPTTNEQPKFFSSDGRLRSGITPQRIDQRLASEFEKSNDKATPKLEVENEAASITRWV